MTGVQQVGVLMVILLLVLTLSECQVTKITEDLRKQVVEAHNYFRNRTASGQDNQMTASNMHFITYSLDIEAKAQGWADGQTFAHSTNDYRKINDIQCGENLYMMSGGSYPTPNLTAATQAWYNEYVDFNKSTLSSYVFKTNIGHYSQLVWAKTTQIGCGVSQYDVSGSKKTLVVCQYCISGNYQNSPVYATGAQCSACPTGTECGTTYNALCKTTGKLEADLIYDSTRGPVSGSNGYYTKAIHILYLALIALLYML